MSNRTVQAAAEGMPADAKPIFCGYQAAFESFAGPIQRLSDLANTQEVLVDLLMGLRDEVRLLGDRKAAVEFLATEIRNQADALNSRWLDLQNGSAPEVPAAAQRVPFVGEVQ